MPQINKIRIVNFNYNDGNRFIPDELYDLTSDKGEALNALFNLNNGGGKTVLVQLMMQPVHPRAMIGERHIEDYFNHPGDHSFILIEWNLDESNSKLLTGIAIAGSTSERSDEKKRGNAIRYYTFKTVYDNCFSSYSIAALDLSKNENGKYVPAAFDYVKEKAKASRGMLEYYPSDEGIKWIKELSEYGIYRSEWETVIEPLNKDEGGLNQFFDDVKSSDKLIAKLFIPAIDNKMKSVTSNGTDSSLETMLINYAKKISEKETVIRERDTNRSLITKLSDLGGMSNNLCIARERLSDCIGEVLGFKASIGKKTETIDESLSNISQEVQIIDSKIRHIEHEEKSKEFYDASEDYKVARNALTEAKKNLEKAREEIKEKKHEEEILQSARIYSLIVDVDGKIKAYKKLIEEKENDSEDAEAIAKLKYSVFVKAKNEHDTLLQSISEKDGQIQQKKSALRNSEADMKRFEKIRNDAKEKHTKISAKLDASKEITDTRVKTLKIEAIRRLDGFYLENEIEDEMRKRSNSMEEIVTFITRTQNEIKELDNKKSIIPNELADVKIELDCLLEKKKVTEKALLDYTGLLESLELICRKNCLENNAIFSGRLKSIFQKEIEMTSAEIRKYQQDKQSLEERLKSANEGHVHILSDIMNYVVSTRINCQTGEDYITGLLENGTITQEKAEEILNQYPEFAFSLLFNNKRDMGKFISSGNVEWLPATVPLFTMEQVNTLMSGNMENSVHLAVFDRTYFADKSDYCNRLENEIESKEEQLQRFNDRLREYVEEKKLVEQFDYPKDWSTSQEIVINELREKVTLCTIKRKELEEEQDRIMEKIDILHDKLDAANMQLLEMKKWLESCEELGIMLAKENELYIKKHEAYNVLKDTESDYKKSCEIHSKTQEKLSSLENERKQQASYLERVIIILENVDNARETEIIEGSMEELYSQYQTKSTSLRENLNTLKMHLDTSLQDKKSREKEIENYACERSEYESVHFSPDALKNVRDAIRNVEEEVEKAQLIYDDCNAKAASAKQRFDAAHKFLEDFEGNPLPQNEVGGDFKARIKYAKLKMKQLNEKKNEFDSQKRSLEKIFDRVEIVLKPLQFEDAIKPIKLLEKANDQWETIHNNFIRVEKFFKDLKEKLQSSIKTTVVEFKNIALSEIVNKLDSVGVMLDGSGIQGDRLYTVCESLSAMTASIEKINSRIETDLREIENDFNDIVDQCMNQGKRMYLDLRMIAASSKVHIFEGKPQTQMVKMDLPEEKEISEEASRISIKTEINQGANEIKELLRNNADEKQVHKRARSIISSERLLHKYIRQESIQIKVYKIDINSANSVYKRWEDTLTQNSGAEKFIVFFSVILTLINYTRSSVGLINRNVKSVLILDNPFGKITSAHLLRPMFDIAKHFNVQLICLSDINKSDVVSCFDCVIKLVIKTQNLSDFEIMTHEGNEKIEHGYYKIMNSQMSLFT